MKALQRNNKNISRFAKNNLVRIIVRVQRAAKRRLDEMRVETGVKKRAKKKLVRSTWDGQVESMGDETGKECICPES